VSLLSGCGVPDDEEDDKSKAAGTKSTTAESTDKKISTTGNPEEKTEQAASAAKTEPQSAAKKLESEKSEPATTKTGTPAKPEKMVAAVTPATTKSAVPATVEKKAAKTDADGNKVEELEPFDPPPLEKLNAEGKWIAQSVVDAFDLLRAKQAKEPPTATVAEALQLKNDSAEANNKILSALGRLPKSDDEVDWDATFNRHLPSDIRSSNPIMFSLAVDAEVNQLTAFSVFAFDWTFTPFAAKEHVVSWEVSADRLLDKVVLRDDLTWSDGHPITAHDVAFSFQLIMNPKVPVPAVRSGTDKLRWVHAYDDRTIVFFHKESLSTNVWNINFPIVPKHIYEKSVDEDPTLTDSDYHVKQENNPVCGGPYTISKRVRGQEIVLERRESYYMHNGKQVRPKPYFKTVRCNIIEDRNTALLALKKGDLDELMLMPDDWIAKTVDDDFYAKNTKATGLDWTEFHFIWNMRTPFFSDVRVRKAMSYAYNYEEMDKVFNHGLYQRSNGMFHPTSWMAPKPPPELYQQDLDKSVELLEQAGWTDSDGDGVLDKQIDGKKVRFEFTIICPSIPDRIKYSTLLKECLDKIGIVCNVKPMEFVSMTELVRKHEYQAAYGGWGTGTDPESTVNIFGTGEMRNYPGYSNAEVDELFKLGVKEFDRQKRAEIYGKIHRIIYEDQPYTWLYCRSSFYGFNKELRGYMFSPRDPYGYSPGLMSIWKPKK
ncbi:MAG: extracellular solute-binding protein family 5, partial [Planctomycetaceae bacterium]|nr:extracellular solute-binding protein family 5 [Planctomycetaceae bacterium]